MKGTERKKSPKSTRAAAQAKVAEKNCEEWDA
jgi:hypothetical protein